MVRLTFDVSSIKAVSAVSRRELAHAHVHRITRTHARLCSHQMVKSRRRSNRRHLVQMAAILVWLGGRFLWAYLRMRHFTTAIPANRLQSWIFYSRTWSRACHLASSSLAARSLLHIGERSDPAWVRRGTPINGPHPSPSVSPD